MNKSTIEGSLPVHATTEYKVVSHGGSGARLSDFESSVNSYVQAGWRPCGGISVALTSSGMTYYYQAMAR